MSQVHCKVHIEEGTGEAWLEVLGQGTLVNDVPLEPGTERRQLEHKDVVLIGGRRLRFEYLPPDYKPISGQAVTAEEAPQGAEETLRAEVVDTEEPEEAPLPPTTTPAANGGNKRVSFGPYLSPEQFDNTLPPATPVKRGATPRRSIRYSGLRFSRPLVEPLTEEEAAAEEQEEEENDENVPEVEQADTMSSVSDVTDVSNVAVVPSECSSYIDEDFDSLPASAPASEVPSPVPETDADRLRQLLDESIEDSPGLSDSQEEHLLQTPGPRPLKELAAQVKVVERPMRPF